MSADGAETSGPTRVSRTVPGWADAGALLAWTLAVAWAFLDAVLLRQALFYFDITEINFPYRDWLAGEYAAGRLSRWAPGLACGFPIFAESQAGFFHPLKLLYLVLPSWQAFNLDVVISVWLVGVGAYAWLRRHVGVAGALAGAAVVGLGGFTWSHLIHTSMANALVSVPLAVWAIEVAWDRGRWWPVSLGAVAIAVQVFAGHLQDVILTGSLLGVYAIVRASQEPTWPARRFVVGSAVAAVLLGGMMAAVQVLPSKDLVERSPRASGLSWDDLTYGSWSPELLPTLLVREAYGTRARDTDWMDGFYPYQEMNVYLGLLTLALAVIGAGAWRTRWVSCWLAIGGLGLLLMLGRYTAVFDVMPWVPIVGSGRIPVRYHLWVTFAVAALAVVGVDRIATGRAARLRPALLTIALLALACVPILVYVYAPVWTDAARWTTAYHQSRYNWLARELAVSTTRSLGLFLIGMVVAGAAMRTSWPRRRAFLTALLPVLMLLDLLGAHAAECPTVDPSYWTEPPESARQLKEEKAVGRVFGLGALSAGEPGYAVKPVKFFAARDTLAWSLAPVWGLRSSGRITPIISERLERYDQAANRAGTRFDLEGVTHVLAGSAGTTPRLEPPYRVGSAWVYRNPEALARARIVGRPVYAKDERDAERQLLALGAGARDRIIVEAPDRPVAEGAPGSGSARIVRDDPEHIEIEATVDGPGPAYLFLADTFDPGWTATVDGDPAPIRPAYIAFRAVAVEPGTHRVVFRYEPVGFRAGLVVSGAGALLAVALMFLRGRGEPPRPEPDTASRWPTWWPWAAIGLAAALVAGSAVRFGEGGKPRLHERWDGSFHRFTWGAKVEAIRPPAPDE
jgi:hypothetical protein